MSASRIRLGAVGYLNARPLVYGLDRDPRFDVRFDVPSRCATLLHARAIDVGLIPSIEYLSADYRIVPGLAIASKGRVASVALYTTRPMGDVRSIALDTSSRTSVALTRVLCARLFRTAPAYEAHGPDLAAMLARADAALIIGDNALFLDAGVVPVPGEGRREVRVEKIDLGEAWLELTGLPFVYAFWAGPAGVLAGGDVQALQEARDEGVRHPDEIGADSYPGDRDRQQVAARYLRDNIKYYLGDEERAALELFYRYAAESGVTAATAPLRFF